MKNVLLLVKGFFLSFLLLLFRKIRLTICFNCLQHISKAPTLSFSNFYSDKTKPQLNKNKKKNFEILYSTIKIKLCRFNCIALEKTGSDLF